MATNYERRVRFVNRHLRTRSLSRRRASTVSARGPPPESPLVTGRTAALGGHDRRAVTAGKRSTSLVRQVRCPAGRSGSSSLAPHRRPSAHDEVIGDLPSEVLLALVWGW